MIENKIRIGTRGSQLALWQANHIKESLHKAFPALKTEIKIIRTKGDKILDTALSKIGDKGLFTKELEYALLNNEIDVAVHSLKDMPAIFSPGLKLAAVSERGSVNDVLVSAGNKKLNELTGEDVIATSSLRRKAGLMHLNQRFNIVDIRGNINTRLKKMQDGHCAAMILAAAGLERLGLEEFITEKISVDTLVPAAGQGVIGMETLEGNDALDHIMEKINQKSVWTAMLGERTFLEAIEGGCQVPAGCYAELSGSRLTIRGFIASVDGRKYVSHKIIGETKNAAKLGESLALSLIEKGGDEIRSAIREENRK